MDDAVDKLMESVRQDAEARSQTLGKLLTGADASRVFGQPVTSGDYTVIPAAEVASGGGFGSGMGLNTMGRRRGHGGGQSGATWEPSAEGSESGTGESGGRGPEAAGGGGGGGGGSMGRPVAAIVIGPHGVRVRPVIDINKLMLTALGAWATLAALSLKMWSKRS